MTRCAELVEVLFIFKTLLAMCALEAFTGRDITTKVVRDKINHPCNAINLQNDAHESFNKLAWGIEAQERPGGYVSYLIFSIDPTV